MDIGEEQNRATGEWHPEYYIWSIKEFGKKWSLCIRRRCGVFTSPIFQSGENSKYEWCLEFTPNSRLRLKLLNFDQHKNTEMNIKTCVSFINDEDETKNCSAFGELIVDENELIYSHALSTASAYKKKIFPVGKFKILIRIIPSSSEFELHDKEHLIDIMNSAVILDDKDSILSLPDPMIQLRSYKRKSKSPVDNKLKKKFIPMFIKIEDDKTKNEKSIQSTDEQQEYQELEMMGISKTPEKKELFIINNNNDNKIIHTVDNLLTSSKDLSGIVDENKSISEIFNTDSSTSDFDDSGTSSCDNIDIPENNQIEPVIYTKNNLNKQIELSSNYLHMPFSDIVLNVRGKKFESHKAILSASSTVLADIIKKNKSKKEIFLNNIKPEVAKQMLEFIYTHNMPSKHSEFINELIDAAHKFNIIKLKELCENVLIRNMSSNIAVESFIIGDFYQSKKIKNAAFKCFHDEISMSPALLESSSFNYMKNKHPKLAVELILESYVKKLNLDTKN
ncbi:hypothetical protein HCN44_005283 [Aphidius gifuensis]|uniref:BTB domain-containing protein n=1 Tax=Aphidius gifuensis TaxID=684658 RepID=A0A834Y5S5_APHGI|nr:hypothetical protein HCN44_005283 [Aphidius gifuensis]